ncbi:MAG: hypothetical protein ND895_12085, partial [Pyrinomonadaceae bacterium]|nr:hypothetical protein [Pyrinomonadaceae bacterium]
MSARRGVEVLGQFVQPTAGDSYEVGDYAAVIDWSTKASKSRILEVRPIASRYVPGASEVYLRSAVQASNTSRARLRAGNVDVDYSAASPGFDSAVSMLGTVVSIRGTQPAPRGVVLGRCMSVARDLVSSREKTKADGSLGTGRPDGSLGTGSPDGSLGTGSPDGSLGTGSPDGSLGTGSPDGSLGTGSPDGSLGTGSPDGSLGTGSPDGSLGTGSPDGSLGTGSPDGSLGTGSPDGSLGTGSPDGSLGTGSPDGSLGTGSP